jgi:myo-inositol 2-dehydrogenase / D-chiro-inositol 1-dehydrogenase
MRIGLIGLGRIGAFHASTLRSLDTVTSLVVTDAVPAVTAKVAAEVGAEAVGSVDELLAAGLDGVVIAAATHTHPELIRAAVEAKIPVFCEKPIALAVTEAAELRDQVANATTPIQIGYPRRFDAGFQAARAAVASGELGTLHTVRSTTLDPAPPPEEYIARSGGIFADCSVHDFDAIRYVTGQEVVEVYATGSNLGADFFAGYDDVATASAVLNLDGGAIAVVSNSRYNVRGYDVRMELHGFDDSIAAGLDDHLPIRSAEPGVTFPAGEPYRFFMDRLEPAFRSELAAFVEVAAGRQESPCTIDDGLAAGLIAEACTRSLREHRPVRVDEIRG